MSSFKEQTARDRAVFFNEDEYADLHIINGESLIVIVDYDRLKDRSQKEYDGISVGEILFFIASEFLAKPEKGTPMVFDGRQLTVFDAREDEGILEIILTQNRGY